MEDRLCEKKCDPVTAEKPFHAHWMDDWLPTRSVRQSSCRDWITTMKLMVPRKMMIKHLALMQFFSDKMNFGAEMNLTRIRRRQDNDNTRNYIVT